MKKNLLLPLICILSCSFTHAQIPNASFEDWTNGDPDGWFTGNTQQTTFVEKVTTAHAGSFAAKWSVIDFFGFPFSSPFASGNNGGGTSISSAPEALHGWYMMNSVSNDYANASVGVLQNNEYTGGGLAKLTSTSVYKEFIANVYYTSGSPNGDSIQIVFVMFNDSSELPHEGSYAVIDDLSFGALSGIDNAPSESYAGLESIEPNPGSDQAEVIYRIQEPGKTELSIYDVSGKMVQQVVNENQSPGRYKAFAQLSDLPSGNYICRLTSDSFTDVKKIIVQR